MMRYIAIICVICIFVCVPNNSEARIIGIKNGDLVEIDPQTGDTRQISNQLGITSKYLFTDTFDPNNNYYFVKGTYSDNQPRLFTIDTLTGNMLSNPLVSQDINVMLFDPSENRLLCTPRWTLSTINYSTGDINSIGSNIGITRYLSQTDAIDPYNNFLFLQGFDNNSQQRSYVVDTQTGNILSNTLFPYDFNMTQFDSSTNTLLGMYKPSGVSNRYFSKLNPFTGEITQIGATNIGWCVISTDVIDSASHRYYIQGGYYGEKSLRLFTIDTVTAQILSDPIIPNDITGVQYDPDSVVPEPTTIILFGLGGLSIAAIKRRRKV